MATTNETEVVDVEEEDTEDTPAPTDDVTELKARLQRLEEKAITQRERTRALKAELAKAHSQAEKETPSKTESKSEEIGLLQKTYLRAAGITAEDEVELALTTAKKWGMEVDKVVDDEDFKVKLERLRADKSNVEATANIRGGKGPSQAKNTPEYWIAKGEPPTREQVPDRKLRAQIARAMMSSAKDSKKFYNE